MKIWENKPPGTLWATPGMLRDCFTFYMPIRTSGNMGRFCSGVFVSEAQHHNSGPRRLFLSSLDHAQLDTDTHTLTRWDISEIVTISSPTQHTMNQEMNFHALWVFLAVEGSQAYALDLMATGIGSLCIQTSLNPTALCPFQFFTYVMQLRDKPSGI